MTWAQVTFAFCFGVLVPAVGILSAARLKREGKSRLKGFFLGSGAMFLALVGCCFLAIHCFPRYPHQYVPEVLANAFTLPGIAAGVATIWFVSADRARSKRFCRLASAILVAAYAIGLVFSYEMTLWPYRRALPWSASEIHEWFQTEVLLPDYSYQLKAKLTEEQFHRYVAKLGLTPHTQTRSYSDEEVWLDWRTEPDFQGGWWDPSEALDSTFVWQEGHRWTLAKYERGYLYLQSLEH